MEEQLKQQCQNYLNALATSDLTAVLGLFCPDAIVHSPLYGEQKAVDFYQKLFGDTNNSILTHLDTLVNLQTQTAALYFYYQWQLASEEEVGFHCVDIIHFDSDVKIRELRIIYDTVASRPAFMQLSN